MDYVYLFLGCMFTGFAGGMFINSFTAKDNRLMFFVLGLFTFFVGYALLSVSNATF